MSVTKELIESERQQLQTGHLRDVHLHKEGTFLRAYEWSAWLCCSYLHDFKVSKLQMGMVSNIHKKASDVSPFGTTPDVFICVCSSAAYVTVRCVIQRSVVLWTELTNSLCCAPLLRVVEGSKLSWKYKFIWSNGNA